MTDAQPVGLVRRVQRALSEPVDIAWLVALRVLFGSVMCVSMIRFLAYGWVDSFFVEPSFHFTYYLFGWVKPLPGPLMHGLFVLLACAALCMVVGLFFRAAALLFALGFSYLQLIDVTTYLNHYYLASLLSLLLGISPAARACSLDVLRSKRAPLARVPRLWLFLLRFQVAVVYSFAGLAKLSVDWLIHAQPLRIWLAARTDMPLLGPLFRSAYTPLFMSWAGFLFDSFVIWFLLWPRSRPYAYLTVLTFHAVTSSLFPIGMFPVIMVLGALVYFPPDWPRRLLARLTDRRAAQAVESAAFSFKLPRAALLLLAFYCLVQVAWPLRFLAYGGDVRWHEQGMRFSWRVMVREKNGSVTFRVRQKQTGRLFYVSPELYLTRAQVREMASQPDLILQFAHVLRDDFAARGLGPVSITVDALVAMNGRRMHPLIDPEADLAAISDGLARARWILPAPSERPATIRPI